MQRALIAATVEGTAHRLAINGDGLPIHANRKGLRPGGETTLKILWGDQHEDTAEGVMRRNAVRSPQESRQPVRLVFTIERHFDPTLGAPNHPADGNHQKVGGKV